MNPYGFIQVFLIHFTTLWYINYYVYLDISFQYFVIIKKSVSMIIHVHVYFCILENTFSGQMPVCEFVGLQDKWRCSCFKYC